MLTIIRLTTEFINGLIKIKQIQLIKKIKARIRDYYKKPKISQVIAGDGNVNHKPCSCGNVIDKF